MKLFFAFSLIITSCCSLFAQENNFGFFAGGNYSTLIFKQDRDQNADRSYLLGYNFGAHYTRSFNKTIGMRVELLLQKKGGKFNSKLTQSDGLSYGPSTYQKTVGFFENPDHSVDRQKDFLTYIEVPVLVQLKFGEKINYLIHAGQSLGYQIKRNNNYTFGNSRPFSKWNYSLVFGPGISLPVGENLHIQWNYYCFYGITDIGSEEGMSVKNLTFSSNFGFQYKIN